MNRHLRDSLKAKFQHVFDGCDLPALETLRQIYNQRAADAKLPGLEREIAQIQIEAIDPFIRFQKNPRDTKHPFQG